MISKWSIILGLLFLVALGATFAYVQQHQDQLREEKYTHWPAGTTEQQVIARLGQPLHDSRSVMKRKRGVVDFEVHYAEGRRHYKIEFKGGVVSRGYFMGESDH